MLKRIWPLLIMCIFLILNVTTIANAKSPLPNGFRNLIWGQTLNDFSEKNSMQDISILLKEKELEKDESAYKRLNNDNMISGVGPLEIVYLFWRGKFEAINAYTQGHYNFDALVESAKKNFGNPASKENNQYFNRIVWQNKKTEIVITMSGNDNLVHLHMKSLAIEDEKKKWKKAHKTGFYYKW
ncbi:MAG TPA: hypothetical protein VGL27_14975 [Negativicutes bacterium]